jgi:5-methylcytosine-specific restriction endonuclease McrA
LKQTKAPKPSKKKLDTICLDLWALCTKTKQKTCRNCNSDYLLQAHHIREKSRGHATRYDLENGLTLCRSCHSIQKFRPEQFHDMIIKIIGQKEYERLKAKSLEIVHIKIPDLIETRDFLRETLRQLKDEYGG